MIEKVSRALCEKARISPEHWRIYEALAHAAVEAMRETTDEVAEAGTLADKDRLWDDLGPDDVWGAMIDAILEGK